MRLADLSPHPLPPGLDLPADVVVAEGVGRALEEAAARTLGTRIVVASDSRCAAASRRVLGPLAATGRVVKEWLLPGDGPADGEAVEALSGAAVDATGILAVGSGTINDVAKMAASRRGLPYVVLGTAASMNGYASGIASILEDGLKTTRSARPPRAILLDTRILQEAPPELARAGLGDLLSKSVSAGDWWISHRLEGSPFSELACGLVDAALERVLGSARGLATGDLSSLEELARALVLSGVSMVIAGSSSPASGGEHLLSHLWDMEALSRNCPLRLHGAQVGVATLITSALYHLVIGVEEPSFPAPRPWHEEAARIDREHGALAASITGPARRKHAGAIRRSEALRQTWPRLREELARRRIPEPPAIRTPLEQAGAPRRLSDLGLSRQDARRTLLGARDIRDRLTVLDLAFELGVLPDGADAVLDAAGV